jgi:hypothetical protein
MSYTITLPELTHTIPRRPKKLLDRAEEVLEKAEGAISSFEEQYFDEGLLDKAFVENIPSSRDKCTLTDCPSRTASPPLASNV